ncbi:hypothetical protein E5843_14610 [Luteimonas yindakuii]|uniref:hypothetical protein n=1 Tax=Luteimonas yindakuii TaxID=2565782 RepID=UPI0011079FA2|nr:hypothetical protein [Luteimonas yindakuii]QCU72705.1 hypothetical protein E5843_14610 [Luteimonas yindakuii]
MFFRVVQRDWRSWWPMAAATVGVAMVLLIAVRQPLADRLWPDTRAQALRAEAAAALASGRLSAADGTGARELYEAALAMDPDRPEARDGLSQVARAALAQAQSALAEERFDDARAALALARELAAPRAAVDRVESALRERLSAQAGLDDVRARARAAYARGDLHGSENSALPLYRRILGLRPDDADALRGREDALGDLLQQAREDLREGRYAEAARAVAVAREFDPGHIDLPDTQARLGEERDALLRQAHADRDAGRLERAEARYRALLESDPDAAEPLEGMEQLALAHARRAERAAADFRFSDADTALAEAARVAPGGSATAAVDAAVRHVERARLAHARLRPAGSPAQRRERLPVLLEQVDAAEQRGDLLTPPGESAYDRLRAARAIAPDDNGVRRAAARLLPAAVACFDRELRGNRLARARSCLDARTALSEDEDTLAPARRRLAQRWLAVGDERLGAGELAAARAAHGAAREIDPTVPELAAFAERLRAAGSVGESR